MIIPTRRTIVLGVVPLLLVAVSRGTPAVIEVAWASLLIIIAAWLIDGNRAIPTRGLLLIAVLPTDSHWSVTSIGVDRGEWNRGSHRPGTPLRAGRLLCR